MPPGVARNLSIIACRSSIDVMSPLSMDTPGRAFAKARKVSLRCEKTTVRSSLSNSSNSNRQQRDHLNLNGESVCVHKVPLLESADIHRDGALIVVVAQKQPVNPWWDDTRQHFCRDKVNGLLGNKSVQYTADMTLL